MVKEIKYEDGTVEQVKLPEPKRVLKPETSEEISRMLSTVVDDALRGGDVALPHHSIGAKTGTAQMTDEGRAGYADGKYLHSFFGYFPAYDPQFIVFLFLKNPKGVNYASQSLIPPFMNITKFLLNYYNVPPDR